MFKHQNAIWDKSAARHLLARTLMTGRQADIDFAMSMTLEEFVENHLLSPLPQPEPPGAWADTYPLLLNGPYNDIYLEELGIWYLKLLQNHSYSFQERMMLFLHNHFTTEARKSFQIQRVYQQSKLIRNSVFGDYKQLVKDITVDPAMLVYLDGNTNTISSINENYSRELLELFTIGVGNYSQADIVAGAKALTGWTIPESSWAATLDRKHHYTGKITFMGKTQYFSYTDIVDTIFENPETSKFLCRKLCMEFITPKPDDGFVEEMAALFRESNYNLRPVLKFMLTSEYFFLEAHRATKVKNPVDFVLSTISMFDLPVSNYATIKNFLVRLDLELFNPPDVKGWRGQRKWINSTTYSIRNAFVNMLVYGTDLDNNSYSPAVDVIAFATRFSTHNNAVAFVDDLSAHFFHYPLSAARKSALVDILAEGNDQGYWSISSEKAQEKLQKLLHTALTFPEFQLH